MVPVKHSDFSLDIPEGWTDRSVLVWSAPAGSAVLPPNFVVSYDQLQPGETLQVYANRQVDSLRGLEKWQLVEQRQVKVRGRDAVEVSFTWQTPSARMKQRQLFCALDGNRVASLGSTAPADAFADADARFFSKILANVAVAR